MVVKANRVDFVRKLDFMNEFLVKAPNLNEALLVTGCDQTQPAVVVNACHPCVVLFLLVGLNLEKSIAASDVLK